jgi:microcystin degradation protein MlrC
MAPSTTDSASASDPSDSPRVAIGALKHESNTFTSRRTDYATFDPVEGAAVWESEWAEGSATAGFRDRLSADREVTFVETLFGHALPDGVIERAAYERLRGGILAPIRESASDLDAVYLDLHGSMYAEGEDDPEGALLRAVREAVGPGTPVVASLDMHATVTERMVAAADGFAAYRTAPHTDVYETGARAAGVLGRLLDGAETTVAWERLPMLLAGERSETDAEPMASLIAALEDADDREGVLDASYLLGFPWADSPHNGCYAVVTATGDAAAGDVARDLGERFWARRGDFEFTAEAMRLDPALDALETETRSPVFLSDSGDNPTAGAREDLTIVVEALLERGVEDALVGAVADPDAQAACADAGEGATLDLELGRAGVADDAPPLRRAATVERIGTALGVEAAAVDLAGVTVLVTAERVGPFDPALFTDLGYDPADSAVVVVKLGYLSPALYDLAQRHVLLLTPGDTNEVLADLDYEALPRPVLPLDDPGDVIWEPRN